MEIERFEGGNATEARVLTHDPVAAFQCILSTASLFPRVQTPVFDATSLPESWTTRPVADLTDAGFEAFVSGAELVMLEFYAPWCGACQRYAATYEAVARDARKRSGVLGKVKFARIVRPD